MTISRQLRRALESSDGFVIYAVLRVSPAEVEVDLDRRLITRRGQEINLARQEYNLLAYFSNNADRALSRDAILNAVWGFESYPSTRTVDAHVVRLRQKLEPNPASHAMF